MPAHQPMLALTKQNFHDLEAIDVDNISGMWAVFTKCKANIEHGTRLENMSWRLWFRETANHEVDKDYFSFVPPKNDRLHYIGSSEPSPALSASSTLTASSSRSARQFSPASFIRFISSLSPDHSLKDSLKEQKLKMETTGLNLSNQTDLEITETVTTPPTYRDVEKKDKGRDRGEHEFVNAYQELTDQEPALVITLAPDKAPAIEKEDTHHCNNTASDTGLPCSKMFFIKSDDENEDQPRRPFRSPPHSKHAVTSNVGHDPIASVSTLGSDTDYDSEFDEDEEDDDDLFPNNLSSRAAVGTFCKKPPPVQLKQRSLLSAMLSRRAEPHPIPATIWQAADPIMAKELSDSLRRNVQWELSQKRIGCFKRHATAPLPKPDNPSLSDDEFQGW